MANKANSSVIAHVDAVSVLILDIAIFPFSPAALPDHHLYIELLSHLVKHYNTIWRDAMQHIAAAVT